MHELNVLREFRSDASLPPETQEQARARLEAAIKHGRRRSRRPLLLAAAAALLLVGGGTAYALAREFLVGDPAPPAVQEQARLLNEVKGELIPRVHEGPKIRVEETRLAALLDASTGRVYLWVAPSERGDCLFEQIVGTEMPDGRPNLSGGCGLGGDLAGPSSLGHGRFDQGHDDLDHAQGRVPNLVSDADGEVAQGRLGGAVDGRRGLWRDGQAAGDVDDEPARGDQRREQTACQDRGRREIRPDFPVDIGPGLPVEGDVLLSCGVVYEADEVS